MRQFKLKNGDNSAYALACGYIQFVATKGMALQLWQEVGRYNVTLSHDGRRVHWSIFDDLTAARAHYGMIKWVML